MATNKNQHFVPRCYLRPFTFDSANLAINLFNVDRLRFIERAPVKHQCSGDYFYGTDPALERALKFTEDSYAAALRDILRSGFGLTNDEHRDILRRFWLLQYMRTEAASRREVEMDEEMRSVVGLEGPDFNLSIRQAVLIAMSTFVDLMHAVDDLRVCLLRNVTSVPFVTSDNPAVLSNQWYLEDGRVQWRSFGLHSSGALFFLPLSPEVLCVGYDGDVYRIPEEDGWDEVRNSADVEALNQHQFLNCRANIFVRDAAHAGLVRDSYDRVAQLRPSKRHRIHYAVRDGEEGGSVRYRVVDPSLEGNRHQEAIIHSERIHARPSAWPRRLRARRNGVVFSNGSAAGYVRRARAREHMGDPFRQEVAWPYAP